MHWFLVSQTQTMSHDKQYHALCQHFFDNRMIKINIQRLNARRNYIKAFPKVLEAHVWGIPLKLEFRSSPEFVAHIITVH